MAVPGSPTFFAQHNRRSNQVCLVDESFSNKLDEYTDTPNSIAQQEQDDIQKIDIYDPQ
jgi:hypothetical protein